MLGQFIMCIRKHVHTCTVLGILLWASTLLLSSAAEQSWPDTLGNKYVMRSASDSSLLAKSCPALDLSLYLSFSFNTAGVLLDTVGLNAAADGAWCLGLGSDGVLTLSVYSVKLGDWQRVALASRLQPGMKYHLMLGIAGGILSAGTYEGDRLLNGIGARLEAYPFSGPVYAGDFPGDNTLGASYNIYQACIGEMTVHYFGRHIDSLTADNIGQSTVISQAGPSGNSDANSAKPNSSGKLVVADVAPAQSPEEAVRIILAAQAKGDVPAMLGYTYLDQASNEARLTTQAMIQVIAHKLAFSDLKVDVLGTAYGNQGHLALVRCKHEVQISGCGDSAQEEFGSLVLLRRTDSGWKVIQFMPDSLLNLALADEAAARAKKQQAGVQPPALWSFAGTAAMDKDSDSAPVPGLVDYSKVSQQFNNAITGWKFDEKKVIADETLSWVGLIPLYGDFVSSGYTAAQTIKTIYLELLPDICNGEGTLVLFDIAQVSVGLFQIVTELFPGYDVAADHLGIFVDQWKYNVTQRRNLERVSWAILTSNLEKLEGVKTYLFMRPVWFIKIHSMASSAVDRPI